MPETFQALGVLAVALLPGGLYVWSLERQAGACGVRLADRLLRFVGVSALFHAVLAPITYWIWVDFVRAGRLASGEASLVLWGLILAYVGIPLLIGVALAAAGRMGVPGTYRRRVLKRPAMDDGLVDIA